MRLNYYKFPEGVDPHTRWLNGCVRLDATCVGPGKETRCSECTCRPEDGWISCPYYKVTKAEDTVEGCTVSTAKKLLREFGGHAWTEHIERDGGCFEVSEITLSGNNSQFTYNRHL